MTRALVVALVLNAFFVGVCSAQEPKKWPPLKGLYVEYDEGEYEHVLLLCSSDEAWEVNGGKAQADLRAAYAKSPHSAYGEIYIEAEGKLLSGDSPLSGVFQISRLVRHSSDPKLIFECRKGVRWP